MKKIKLNLLICCLGLVFSSCVSTPSVDSSKNSSSVSSSSLKVWDGKSITYEAKELATFGSATPAGVVNYDEIQKRAIIWNVDASLDNYGGIQTPRLPLDFSKAVIFEMDVISSYSQYIVKLAVEGENEYYYVLADEGTSGLISINVVDAMLSSKFRSRNTQPDPGYATGWKYQNQIKNCSFHILAKGPDGEKQTAELVLGHISISNNQLPVTKVTISSSELVNHQISKLKNANPISLSTNILPNEILDKRVLWSSLDPTIASINENGQLSFVGVGQVTIIAKSLIDQSKQDSITVNVLSGFEQPNLLKAKLSELTYQGSSVDVNTFNDLFATTWSDSSYLSLSSATWLAGDSHIEGKRLILENYFDAAQSAHTQEAEQHRIDNNAYISVSLNGYSSGTLYRNRNGHLSQETLSNFVSVAYAQKNPNWSKMDSYVEKTIFVGTDGSVKKYELAVISSTLLGDYHPSDFVNTNKWTIPDRSKQNEDRVIHALSPASISLTNDVLVMKQNKYNEAKYCFGGIVSPMYTIAEGSTVQMLLDITNLSQMNDYVKTMWEIKIIYYKEDGVTAVSSNPMKVMSGNNIGFHTINLVPTYRYFRIYLVVNGSDIGAQFPNAEMRLRRFKLFAIS